MIKEINGSLLFSDNETTDSLQKSDKDIYFLYRELLQELKFVKAELRNRTASILRLEQKIDLLNMKLIGLDIIKP